MNVRLERGGTCKTNKGGGEGGEGGQKSKTGSLERTYFLNDPLSDIKRHFFHHHRHFHEE